MDNNVDYVSDHLLCLNGKVIEEYIKEHVYAIHVVRRKTYVKFVLWIYSLDYQCKLETRDVERMENI